tara:strand:- start:8667 stop:9392 length:726 start_codon:yes stop_codon:yes gene_type:complete
MFSICGSWIKHTIQYIAIKSPRTYYFLATCFYRVVYAYTYIEVSITSAYEKSGLPRIMNKIFNKYDIGVIHSKNIAFVKNGYEIFANEDLTQAEFVIIKLDDLDILIKPPQVSRFNFHKKYQECMVRFLTFSVTFNVDQQEITLPIELKSNDKGYNYSVEGNSIDKNIIYFLVKKISDLSIFNQPYQLNIVDLDLNTLSLNEKHRINLHVDSYTVFEVNKFHSDDVNSTEHLTKIFPIQAE